MSAGAAVRATRSANHRKANPAIRFRSSDKSPPAARSDFPPASAPPPGLAPASCLAPGMHPWPSQYSLPFPRAIRGPAGYGGKTFATTYRTALRRPHDQLDGSDHFVEGGRFRFQLLPARRSQAIEPGAAVVVRHAPLRLQPALDQHAVQRRVERAVFDLQVAFGPLPDSLGDAVAMQRTWIKGPEDHHVHGAGKQLGILRFTHVSHTFPDYV